ncbi:MAG TPA: SGNH/GDSL hydrolase family protein [Pyrinomonadaceae bacterium]|jgi:lysophospholipase L1-like esterase|nr:SGNH/GDSL hydrolase family protein [Pyrinomonadaceae bacterium]
MRSLAALYRIERPLALLIVAALALGAACGPDTLSQKGEQRGMVNHKGDAPVVYVALGDSTGAGVGARHGGYVARLFERIKHERPASRLINLCVSGATTDDVLLEQVEPGAAARPTLLTLGIGINDAGRGVSVERFARNYEEIIKRIRAKTNAPIVVTNLPDVSLAPVVPVFMRNEARRRIELYNERIAEIARRYKLLVVDAYTETREVIPEHPEFFSEDGFHPSDVGYEYWARKMWPTVKSALGE